MATVYYLNWDKKDSEYSGPRDLFAEISTGNEPNRVSSSEYREVAEVPDGLDAEEIWTAFQRGIQIGENPQQEKARGVFQNARDRSMSVGDVIIKSDGTAKMAVSIGFNAVEWDSKK